MATCPQCGGLLEGKSECPKCGPTPDQRRRLIAALSYLWITALVILFIDMCPKDRFVRFHCLQAILYGVFGLLVHIVFMAIGAALDPFGSARLMFLVLGGLIQLALFLIWVLAALKAYTGVEYALPGMGAIARKYSV